jgi:hypothetical protein
MEHHGVDEKDHQWAIPEEHPDTFYRAGLLAVLCATGELVVNLAGVIISRMRIVGIERATTKKKILRLETR